MSDLKTIDKQILEKLLHMQGGFVLNFSDKTMASFFQDDLGINIYDEKYFQGSGSKANYLRAFWRLEENFVVSESIKKLLEYIQAQISLGELNSIDYPENLQISAKEIAVQLVSASTVKFRNFSSIDRSFVKEQIHKCEKKLMDADFDGAITNARSLVEDAIARDIHKQITGHEMDTSGDLTSDYTKIKKLLHLDEDKKLDNSFNQVARGLSSIVSGLADIANKMGDRHSQFVKPERRHAQLAVNSAKTVVDFLYDVLEYQNGKLEQLKVEILNLPYVRYGAGDCYYGKCFSIATRKSLLSEKSEYEFFLKKCDEFIQRKLLDHLIKNFSINNWNDSDRFFVSLTLLSKVFEKSHVELIFKKTKNNKEAPQLLMFLQEIKDISPEMLSEEMNQYISRLEEFNRAFNEELPVSEPDRDEITLER